MSSTFEDHEDLRQSPCYAQFMADLGWTTSGKRGSKVFWRLLWPLLIAKAQRISIINTQELKNIKSKGLIAKFHIEPALKVTLNDKKLNSLAVSKESWDRAFQQAGMKRKTSPLAHSATSIIDLRQSEQKLLENLKQKTRYNLRLAERKFFVEIKRIPFAQIDDVMFASLFQLQKDWRKVRPSGISYPENHLKSFVKAFAKHGSVYLAYFGKELLAALYVPEWDKVATYYCAISTGEGYRRYAPTLLTWEMIRQSKKDGCDFLDFGGIYDARFPKDYKHWKGFTKFKEGFGDKVALYPNPVFF